MIDNTTLIQILQSRFACEPALVWLGNRNSDEMWEQCERPDWLLWWAAPYVPRTQLVWVACQCARLALPHVTAGDIRPLKAIETAEAWTRGEATLEEVKSAARNARVAYAAESAALAAAAAAADAADAADDGAGAYAAYAAAAAADAAAYAAARTARVEALARVAHNDAQSRMREITRKQWPTCPEPGVRR